MKAAGLILNFFFPGVGSLVIGKTTEGVIQLILFLLGWLLIMTVLGAIIGIPMALAAWIWGLVTAASAPDQPAQVHVIHTTQQPPATVTTNTPGSDEA